MRNVAGAIVTSSTADSVAPARFEHLRVNYVYGGTKLQEDEPPPSARTGSAGARDREGRKAQFKAILAEQGHVDLNDPAKPVSSGMRNWAGREVGVTAKIALRYLKELAKEQAEEAQAS